MTSLWGQPWPYIETSRLAGMGTLAPGKELILGSVMPEYDIQKRIGTRLA